MIDLDEVSEEIDIEGPEIPPDAEHIWAWFLDLHQARGGNGFGPNPISWRDLVAWRDLTGVTIYPAEIMAIMELDRLWLKSQADKPKAPARPVLPKPEPRSPGM